MEKLKIKNGFDLSLCGKPDISTVELPEPDTVAVSAMDIPYIRPRILVKENDPVLTGTPLFCDKRNKSVQYLSPGTGTVEKIVFGPRRKLIEIVIRLDKKRLTDEAFIKFETIDRKALKTIPRTDLVKLLQKGGLWQCFRQFPAKDTADHTHIPAMIIVSMNGNDIFSPHPHILLNQELDHFQFGIEVLRQLTRKVVVTCRKDSMKQLHGCKDIITHLTPDTYPAWDPGTVLYKLKQCVADNASWTISAEHLILVAKLLHQGRYPVKRVVTVTRSDDQKPHIFTRQGAPVKNLIGQMDPNAIITTGRFNGRIIDPDTHLGFFETTINIIHGRDNEEMFGFLLPGFSKPTVSRAFASRLSISPKDPDCTLHGEERACINCGYCTAICPVDLNPSFIMKALHSDDIEEALGLGLLDCCRCGLCAYTCPSKIELVKILSDGMDAHFKDKE